MKILHIISSADPAHGGPIEGIRQRAVALTGRGHTVEVASTDDPSSAFIADFPLPLHALGPGRTAWQYSKRLKDWLVRHVDDYDALVVNGLWQYPGVALRAAAKRRKKPYWVFTHGMLDPWFNRVYPLKRLKKSLIWPWQHAVLRDAQAVLFTSEEERLLARQSFRPYHVRERVVAYGTSGPVGDPAEQAKRFDQEFPQLRGKRKLLFLSRIHPKKGCDLLLEAFSDLAGRDPSLVLVMAGPCASSYRAELEAIVVRGGLEGRVVWTGMLQGDMKWGAFRCADAFILPSHQENFGIAVVEALACSVPVLITRPVNIWREIESDGAGLIADDTLQGVKFLLDRWLEVSQEERRAMAGNAVWCYRNRFTHEKAADSLLEAVQSAMNLPPR